MNNAYMHAENGRITVWYAIVIIHVYMNVCMYVISIITNIYDMLYVFYYLAISATVPNVALGFILNLKPPLS